MIKPIQKYHSKSKEIKAVLREFKLNVIGLFFHRNFPISFIFTIIVSN
jgi:hypothetical protein